MRKGDPVLPEAPNPPFPELESDIVIIAPTGVGARAVAVSPDFVGERPLPCSRCADGRLEVLVPRSAVKAYTLVRIAER